MPSGFKRDARKLEAKRRWDAPETDVVYRWERAPGEEYRGVITWHDGRWRADIRRWRLVGEEWHPTRQGVGFGLESVARLVLCAHALDAEARRRLTPGSR